MAAAPPLPAEVVSTGITTRTSAPGPFRSVLIVSPHFPPINAPDHHRVRMALPHLAKHGWQAEILAVRPEDVEASIDPDLANTLPRSVAVHWTRAWPARWTRRAGVGSLALRSYQSLRNRGNALLTTGRFDLVLFSTTQFGVLPLGPYWKKRYGIPYVLDFQDEWCGFYYEDHPENPPPGGRLKYACIQWLARHQEPEVLREASQILSVSRSYNERMRARYPSIPRSRFHELTFGASVEDFDFLESSGIAQDFFDPADGRRHWVYVGRGGADMHRTVDAFFAAVRRALAQGMLHPDALRIHFIGTSYAPESSARPGFLTSADRQGLHEIVSEHPARAPYFTALRCLREASAVLVFGSDDIGYSASKIFPALLAARPLLAIFDESSSAAKILRTANSKTVITFRSGEPTAQLEESIFREWIITQAFDRVPAINAQAVALFSVAEMTRRLCEIFGEACTAAAAVRR